MSAMTATTILPMDDTELARCCFPEGATTPGAVATERGHLPLAALDVRGFIVGLDVRVTVEQVFVNAFDVPLEATYIFPLPDRLGVTAFRLKVKDRVIEGQLQERGEARRTYDEAITKGHRAAIAEQERPDVFTVRAGNIPPGERVTIALELAGPIAFVDGEAVFRFPLVVPPRYIPGVPLDGAQVGTGAALDTDAVPDASRISPPVRLPGLASPVRLGLHVSIQAAGLAIEKIRSSLHSVQLGAGAGGAIDVSLAEGCERLDRDFILRFAVAGEDIRTSIVTYRPDGESEGFYALTVLGPTPERVGLAPRDVVIVLDRSGSMAGWKIAAARRAAGRIVDSLTDRDRVAVLLFDNSVTAWTFDGHEGLTSASDRARFRAVEFLAGAQANGGTEMGEALERAVAALGSKDSGGGVSAGGGAGGAMRERIVVLVTDGQVGNVDQLLSWVHDRAGGVRIHTIGIDRSVNASFLRQLAEPTGGTFEPAESEDQLDRVMTAVHRRIGGPVLLDVTLRAGDLAIVKDDDSHHRALDVFPGAPARIFGRLGRGSMEAQTITVCGTLPGGTSFKTTVTPVASNDPVIRTAWARQRVLDMEHAYVVDGERNADRAKAITEHSLRYGVLCRFTAFVAVDRSQIVNAGGQGHRVTQPVDAASGWAMLAQPPMPAPARMVRAVPAACAPRPARMMAMLGAPAASPAGSAGPGDLSIMPPASCAPAGGSSGAARAAGKLSSAVRAMKGMLFDAIPTPPAPPIPPEGRNVCDDLAVPDPSSPAQESHVASDDGILKVQPPEGLLRDQTILAFRVQCGDALRALLERNLRTLRSAPDDAGVAIALNSLRSDLRSLIAALRAIAGRFGDLLADLETLLIELERLAPSRCIRGDAELGALARRLAEAIEKLLGVKADPARPPVPPARPRDFWR